MQIDQESHAKATLSPEVHTNLPQAERLKRYKSFLSTEEERIKKEHETGALGLKVSALRAQLMDHLLISIFDTAITHLPEGESSSIALVADGGYGRGGLNPGSDIDILFLLPQPSNKINPVQKEFIEEILYILWDLNFKVGHASRSINECLTEAKRDPLNRTCLLDVRLLAGNPDLFKKLESSFFNSCLKNSLDDFLEERRLDIITRHRKYSGTVFLQEPNIKESPGGMRDYQNLIWILYARRGTHDLHSLVEEKSLTQKAYNELTQAFEFLHRVRNELHYTTASSSDILTLRLQGVIADNFAYPQENILRRIEAFMRDYYTHTKHIHQHTLSIFEIFQIEIENAYADSWKRRLIPGRSIKQKKFGAFISKEDRVYAANKSIFKNDPSQMMQLFLEAQKRNLRLSPPMRKLIKSHLHLVDTSFKENVEIKHIFHEILTKKGNIARSLRQMHRVEFLGAYLPEFGALTCLVQHEFFHRYTADEHTLRCVEELDKLFANDDPEVDMYRKLYKEIEDPYALSIAMLMHDAGRAENVREHIDGSAVLASDVCNRLKIRGESRRLITFLVDHHLTLYSTATKMDISDPRVIEDFASQMKEVLYLDALLVFTYADSKGTNEDGWSKWKESLILRLYRDARHYLSENEHESEEFAQNKAALLDSVLQRVEEHEVDGIHEHFQKMPALYFRYRHPRDITLHARTIAEYQSKDSCDKCDIAVNWIELPKLGYTVMVVAAQDQPYLLERITHALAHSAISILAADVFTREDGTVLDLFRVTTSQEQALTSKKKQHDIVEKIEKTCRAKAVSKDELIMPVSIMAEPDPGITVPTKTWIDNLEHPECTIISIQAIDRIGLLFEILREIRRAGFSTARARICTEKGVAMDSIYVTDENSQKILDEVRLESVIQKINSIIGLEDPTVPEQP